MQILKLWSYLCSDDGFYYSREELTKNHINVHVEGSQDLPEDNPLSMERLKKKRVTLEQLEQLALEHPWNT